MSKSRLEAFSDGVIAIIITIMVLELHAPAGPALADLWAVLPTFLVYLFSFVFVGIYWNNHHHLLQAAKQVDGAVLWANLHLLFWLSLIPFAAAWIGEHHLDPWPVALYGVVLLLAGFAYYLLSQRLVALHGSESALGKAVGRDTKGLVSLVLYLVALPLAFLNAWLAWGVYVVVSIIWLIPDRRIEKTLAE